MATLCGNKGDEMGGMTTKYVLEFRRPPPELRNAPDLDTWHYVDVDKLMKLKGVHELVEVVTSAAFEVPGVDMVQTGMTAEDAMAGWGANRVATSLFISSNSAAAQLKGLTSNTSQSASGDRCAVRRVAAMSVPHLCIMFREYFTASEIEQAWLKMPLVRKRKKARGTNAGESRRAAASGAYGRHGRW